MQIYISIQDFTGVYEEQPFMKELKNSAGKIEAIQKDKSIFWMDCTQITGTDCYCDDEAQLEINKMMDEVFAEQNRNNEVTQKTLGIHFFDNGNYHYMSKLWTDRIQEPFNLVVFDHHPDMQPPRFAGILSCGGWVKEVLDNNQNVGKVVLIGVADHLIEEIQNEPSTEFERYKDRVSFIPESVIREATNGSISALETFSANLSRDVYISIDKDALSTTEAATNWDQGSLTYSQLQEFLEKLFASHTILGVDICGERAREQDFAEGMDQGTADKLNNSLNKNLLNLLNQLANNDSKLV